MHCIVRTTFCFIVYSVPLLTTTRLDFGRGNIAEYEQPLHDMVCVNVDVSIPFSIAYYTAAHAVVND